MVHVVPDSAQLHYENGLLHDHIARREIHCCPAVHSLGDIMHPFGLENILFWRCLSQFVFVMPEIRKKY
jgi:hypothetical protein